MRHTYVIYMNSLMGWLDVLSDPLLKQSYVVTVYIRRC